MRNARGQQNTPRTETGDGGQSVGNRIFIMKNTLLFTTLIAGLALAGCNKSTRTATDTTAPATTDSAVTTTPTTTDTASARMERAGDRVADATRNAADNVRDASRDAAASMRQAGRDVSARMTEWRLSASDIEADVMAKRPVVRTRTDAVTPTGKIDKDTLESAIKGRLHADPKLADLKFDVNANNKGEVELEGKARTTDQIAHAMAVALDSDSVTKVTSKIKLDPDAGPNRR
jgi:osmotically-inducible protein OsmY